MRHKKAMLVATHKSELAELPAAGEEWRWIDVVDFDATGDGISKSVAQRARSAGLIEPVGDSEYVTARELEQYLAQKHEIELRSHRDDEQAQLPVDAPDRSTR